MIKINIHKELTELFLEFQEEINHRTDIPYDKAKLFFDKYNDIHTKILSLPLTLKDFLEERQKENNLRGDMMPPVVYAYLYENKFFDSTELAALTGTTRQNILSKVKRGQAEIAKVTIDVDIGNSFDKFNATDSYVKAIEALVKCLDTQDKSVDKLQVIRTFLQYVEPEVMNELKRKFQTLNGLINFILNILIPITNKRLRALIREIQEKARKGENVSNLQIDLRAIMKELLPQAQELYGRLKKENMIEAE